VTGSGGAESGGDGRGVGVPGAVRGLSWARAFLILGAMAFRASIQVRGGEANVMANARTSARSPVGPPAVHGGSVVAASVRKDGVHFAAVLAVTFDVHIDVIAVLTYVAVLEGVALGSVRGKLPGGVGDLSRDQSFCLVPRSIYAVDRQVHV